MLAGALKSELLQASHKRHPSEMHERTIGRSLQTFAELGKFRDPIPGGSQAAVSVG